MLTLDHHISYESLVRCHISSDLSTGVMVCSNGGHIEVWSESFSLKTFWALGKVIN